MLGRIANFINSELYGRVADVSWAVKFRGAGGFRHPSQLYESFKNLAIFSVLWFVKDIKRLAPGFIFWLFITLFGALRFAVEFFRLPDKQLGFVLGPFSMGQLLSLPMFILGIIMIFVVQKSKTKSKD